MKKRICSMMLAILALFGVSGATAGSYVVMPNTITDFAAMFNTRAASLGGDYAGLNLTKISLNRKRSTFTLRGPESRAYAYSSVGKFVFSGEYDSTVSQRLASITLTATPLEKEYRDLAAYRTEWTIAALMTLESLVNGVTRAEAEKLLNSLEMPIDYNVTGSFYSYPVSLMSKGVSITGTLNSYPLTLSAEITQAGKFTMTAKLAGIYPYPTATDYTYVYPSSTYYPGYPNYPGSGYPYYPNYPNYPSTWSTWTTWETQPNAVTLSPGITQNVRVGEAFYIRLGYTDGDGHAWQYSTEGDGAHWLEYSRRYAANSLPGLTQAMEEWRFVTSKAGTITITFLYTSGYDNNVAQAARYVVNIY